MEKNRLKQNSRFPADIWQDPALRIQEMQTIKELYKIGPGPSSSHTFGPMKASEDILKKYPEADRFKIRLMGSLALTGKGHLTDKIIQKTLRPKKSGNRI